MEVTRKDFDTMIQIRKKIKAEALELLTWLKDKDSRCLLVASETYGIEFTLNAFNIGLDYIEINFVERWAYGGKENYHYEIPIEAIFNKQAWKDSKLKEIKKEEERLDANSKKKARFFMID